MKVTNTPSPQIQRTDSSAEAKESKGAKRTGNAGISSASTYTSQVSGAPSASAEISGRAKEMAKAKEIANEAGDVREAKIAALKQRIANKEYNVKPEAIAERIVDEHLATGGA